MLNDLHAPEDCFFFLKLSSVEGGKFLPAHFKSEVTRCWCEQDFY